LKWLKQNDIQTASHPDKSTGKPGPKPAGPAKGLVGYWSFDGGNALDDSGHGHHGTIYGHADFVDGIRGKALRLSGSNQWVKVHYTPELDLKDDLTVAAWVNYERVTPDYGSQIVWWGDRVLGHDPYQLQLLPDGTLRFRTDRGVTGKPKHEWFANEQHWYRHDTPVENQHVWVKSTAKLEPRQWHFLAATLEKSSGNQRHLKLYLDGEYLGDEKTDEPVDYPTSEMWLAIGAVDEGNWQNLTGLIDEVRIYDRALSKAELQALHNLR